MNQPITAALRLARQPENDILRVAIASYMVPHLRPGENVDTGALRVLADEVERLLAADPAFGMAAQTIERILAERDAYARDFRAVSDALRERTAERDALLSNNKMIAADRDQLRTLTEKLIAENNTLRGPVPPIVPGEVYPPTEILDIAWKLGDWMRANGHRDGRIAGLCDSSQVDRLQRELAEARAAHQRLDNHIDEEHVAAWKKIQAILPEKPLKKASSLVEDVIDCIQELRAENGRQAATIAEARRQFDILSKLGNGDRVGPSVGNRIAVKALEAMGDPLVGYQPDGSYIVRHSVRIETPHTGRDNRQHFRDWMEGDSPQSHPNHRP